VYEQTNSIAKLESLIAALPARESRSGDEPWFHFAPALERHCKWQERVGGADVRCVILRSDETVDGTISFGPDIAGTDLIYDLTGEFLQGKARPFECSLPAHLPRIFAVLPFQLEQIVVEAKPAPGVGDRVQVRVGFQQASGEPIRGEIPFTLRMLRADGTCEHESLEFTDA